MQNWRWTEIGTKQQGVIKADNMMEAFYLLQHRGLSKVSIVHISDEEAAALWRKERQQRMNAAFAAAIHVGMSRPRTKPQSDGSWLLAIAMIAAVVLAVAFPGQAGLLIAAAIAALCVSYIVPE